MKFEEALDVLEKEIQKQRKLKAELNKEKNKVVDESNAVKRFGANVHKNRLKNNMEIKELAKASGVSYNLVLYVENGERAITLDSAEKLAKGLGMNLWELV